MQLTITGPEIKAARLRAGLTRKQLGAALLVHPSAVCNWENEKSGITRKHHATLHRVLDLGPTQDKAEEASPAQEANGAQAGRSVAMAEAAAKVPSLHPNPSPDTLTIRLDRRLAVDLQRLARSEYRTPEAQVSWIVKQYLEARGGEG
jgi:transcriptional regulator with XRE-family HTH domain